MDEGRLPLATVEALRATENEKWLAYYEAQHSAEVARLNVLRQTGTLGPQLWRIETRDLALAGGFGAVGHLCHPLV